MPTYKEAGVDLDKADRLVDQLSEYSDQTEQESTHSPYETVGDFASGIDLSGYANPVMFSTCDGVGTKFLLQKKYDCLQAAGRDLVAMNVNDVLTTGADPVKFLDYVAMSPLENKIVESLVEGMAQACKQTGCLLAGGETAELPGMLEEGDVELAGFCVGIAEKNNLERIPAVSQEQAIFGLPSNGFHANGFSLVRAVIDESPEKFDENTIRAMLEPTRLYRDFVTELKDTQIVPSAMVHVTGGGLRNNLERVLPDELGATLEIPEWNLDFATPVIDQVSIQEAFKTFNMGYGWLVLVAEDEIVSFKQSFPEADRLGSVTDEILDIHIRYGGKSIG